MRVAIIGMGVAGRAQARMLEHEDVVTWDVSDAKPYPVPRIAACDFAVICVGTPALGDGSADLHAVYDAAARLPAGLPVLIRSTVPPGTTDRIARIRPGTFCHSPEFLHERPGGAWKNSTDVPWMLLGGAPEAREFFRGPLARVFPGKIHECTALEAELAKYAASLYWAARVTFVNEMAAVAAAHGAGWEPVRAAWLQDARVGPEYTSMDGFGPGFSGRCWPKDLTALIAASDDAGYPAEFLAAVRAANARFRA